MLQCYQARKALYKGYKMTVAVIKYNAGNTRSVCDALTRANVEFVLTDSEEVICSASHVILPGVGEASTAMNSLRGSNLDKIIPSLKQPVLGVCLGMQLLCQSSEENNTECLGIVPEKIVRFPEGELKVPHMGWNKVQKLQGLLFTDVSDGEYVYFAHSFYLRDSTISIATSNYREPFTAALSYRNFFGVQFHPEKSGKAGARIIENFLRIQ